MTFEEWLDTKPDPDMILARKQMDDALLRIAKAAWQAGYEKGCNDTVDGFNEAKVSTVENESNS